MQLDDNRFNNPECRRILEGLGGWQKRAWLNGEWDIAAGQFFTTFRRDVHVVDQFDDARATDAVLPILRSSDLTLRACSGLAPLLLHKNPYAPPRDDPNLFGLTKSVAASHNFVLNDTGGTSAPDL